MMTDDLLIAPFSCGTQYMDWLGANCERCTKGWHTLGLDESEFYENKERICPMEFALQEGAMGNGRIPLGMAEAMGATEHKNEFQWMCPAWEPTEEWKAERRKCDA